MRPYRSTSTSGKNPQLDQIIAVRFRGLNQSNCEIGRLFFIHLKSHPTVLGTNHSPVCPIFPCVFSLFARSHRGRLVSAPVVDTLSCILLLFCIRHCKSVLVFPFIEYAIRVLHLGPASLPQSQRRQPPPRQRVYSMQSIDGI